MISMTLNAVIVFLHLAGEFIPAALVPIAAAVLLACALGCACTPCRAKDRFFDREVY